MLTPYGQYMLSKAYQDELLRKAARARFVTEARLSKRAPTLLDRLLARCGDFLISLGSRLKRRSRIEIVVQHQY